MPRGDEPLHQQTQGEPRRPRIIAIASWIWIIDGCLDLICLALLLTVGIECVVAGEATIAISSVFFLTATLFAVFGTALLYVGRQTLRGRARDTRGNGIGSLLISLYLFGEGVFMHPERLGSFLSYGTALLVPGVLALLGRRQYKEWHEARNANQPA